jgi:energy-coupling factor transporter ATP-binding protein EcfA2
MKLEKLILVNWGALRSDEYPMGNMTLLTGSTGSGKSTMLDALQTVMTAAYQNIFNYNPGQDESSQNSRSGKSKRTLWSYVTGAEDNLFARPHGAHGYIAAVFKPSEGEDEGEEFTAIIAAAARVDGSGGRRQAVPEKLVLLLVDGVSLHLSDLMQRNLDDSLEVIPVEKIESHLKAKYAAVTSFRDAKREYLCQLYGRFRGQKSVSFIEAELAAKAWSQSIVHRPIGSVDELVKTQILEHDPQQLVQRISQISDLMRQVHNLRVEGERLKDNVTRLERIGTASRKVTNAYELSAQNQMLASKLSLQDAELQIDADQLDLQQMKRKIADETALIDGLQLDKKARSASLVQIAARLSGIPAADQKQRIDERLQAARLAAKNTVAALVESLREADKLQTTARIITEMKFPLTHKLLSEAGGVVAETLARSAQAPFTVLQKKFAKLDSKSDDFPRTAMSLLQELSSLGDTFADLHEVIAGTQDSFVAAVHSQIEKVKQELESTQNREKELAERKANLATGGADYPKDIAAALKAFKTQLPEANAQVLCDLIEPVHPDWQPAIEGYMGGARFNFVVNEKWEAKAIDFVKTRHLRASVVQGKLCLKNAKPERVPDDSIIHELKTEHPVAQAYLVDLYGSVVKVENSTQLAKTSRGVMKDGKGSGSRTMFSGTVAALVFGKASQNNAFERIASDHAQAEAQLQELQSQLTMLKGLLGLAGAVKQPDFGDISELDRAAREIEAAYADLSRLNLDEVTRLEEEKLSLQMQIEAMDKAVQQASQRIGTFDSRLGLLSQSLTQLDESLAAKRQQVSDDVARLKHLCVLNESLSYTALEQQVVDWTEKAEISPQQAQNRMQQQLLLAAESNSEVREAIADYNRHAKADEQLNPGHSLDHRSADSGPIYGALVALAATVRAQLDVQREIGLVKNLDQLRTSEVSFRDVFTKQFCYEIRNTVDVGVRTLKTLNSELERLKFGTDKFSIDWSEWVPEFKAYYDFFSAAYDLSEAQESADLFGTTDLTPANLAVRDQLVGLLLSNDQNQAIKELQRVADYRNYRRYEIWKESDSGSRVPLSEWGTGSGGQLETPAYIIRAAVVTNRLKHFDKGMNLKLLVNDESFAKMDERRAHDVIKFIRDSLGMQLICAMPTKHAGAIKSEFTKEWSVTRTEAEGNGEVDFISEADERDLNTDALRKLWQAQRDQIREQAQMMFEAGEISEV